MKLCFPSRPTDQPTDHTSSVNTAFNSETGCNHHCNNADVVCRFELSVLSTAVHNCEILLMASVSAAEPFRLHAQQR